VRAAVDAGRAGEALKALRDGIAALRQGDDFDAVFVRARRKVAQRLIHENAASRALAQRLALIAEFGLRPDHYQKLLQQVAMLSPAQVKALIAAELAASGEFVVASADRATLTAAFAAAGIADANLIEPPRE
jgi:predicted Zn-dependent peptidase